MDTKELEKKIDEKVHGAEISACAGGGIGEHATWNEHHNEERKEDK